MNLVADFFCLHPRQSSWPKEKPSFFIKVTLNGSQTIVEPHLNQHYVGPVPLKINVSPILILIGWQFQIVNKIGNYFDSETEQSVNLRKTSL